MQMQRIGKKHALTRWQERGRSAAAGCWWWSVWTQQLVALQHSGVCSHNHQSISLTQVTGSSQTHASNLREQNHNDDRMMENTFTLAYCCWRNSNKLLMSTDPTLRPTKDQICQTDESHDCMCHCYHCLWKRAHKCQILANLTGAGLQCDALKPCQSLKR